MNQLFLFLQQYVDYFIFGLLGLMSVILVWKIIERAMFYKGLNVSQYQTQEELEIDSLLRRHFPRRFQQWQGFFVTLILQ